VEEKKTRSLGLRDRRHSKQGPPKHAAQVLTTVMFDFHMSVHFKYISKVQPTKCKRFLDPFIYLNCSTCFRRFPRPSSGAQNCTYSVRYCQNNTAAIVDEMELSSISSTIAVGSSIGLTIPDDVCTVLCS